MKNPLLEMTGLTENDLAERRNYITATDCPAIMQTSPWKGPGDVFYEKTAELEPLEPSDAMIWGSLMERILIAYSRYAIGKHLGVTIRTTKNGCRRKHDNGIMSATLDARIEGRPEAIECKTHALTHRNVNLEEWGAEWTAEIPPYYRDQVLGQLACSPDLDRVYVVLCAGFTRPRFYVIERADHLERITEIEETVCNWWEAHIIPNVPPAEFPELDTVKRMTFVKDAGIEVTGLPDQLLERRKKIGSLMTRLDKEKDKLDAELMIRMGKALQGVSPKGHRVRMVSVSSGSYTVKAKTYFRTNIYLENN